LRVYAHVLRDYMADVGGVFASAVGARELNGRPDRRVCWFETL
jgi:hypothetical protein